MTQEQKIELNYLLDIVMEASKFKIEDGQDAIRLEVESRIENLMSNVEVEGETEVQDEPEVSPEPNEDLESPEKADDARSLSRSKWESSKVRCSENGRLVWRPRSECQKVPRDTSKGGPKWKWQWMGPQDKQAQEEQMWEQHEAENA